MQTEAFTENGYERWTHTHPPIHPLTHTHTHTHTHTQRLKAQFIKKVRQHWGWAEDKALFIKETCSSCFAYVHFQSQLTAKYFPWEKVRLGGNFCRQGCSGNVTKNLSSKLQLLKIVVMVWYGGGHVSVTLQPYNRIRLFLSDVNHMKIKRLIRNHTIKKCFVFYKYDKNT